MKENWQEENLRKTKEVLTKHFERRKQERMLRDMDMAFRPQYTTIELHSGTSWDTDNELSDFYDKLIWDTPIEDIPIEKKSIFNKIKDVFSGFYWNLRYNLWLIKHIITKRRR